MWSPPTTVAPEHVTRVPWKAPVPALRDAVRSALLLARRLGAAHVLERALGQPQRPPHRAGRRAARRAAGAADRCRRRLARQPRPQRRRPPLGLAPRARARRGARRGPLPAARRDPHGPELPRRRAGADARHRCSWRSRAPPSRCGGRRSAAPSVVAVSVILLRAVWQTTRAAALLDRALDRATRAEGFVPVALHACPRRGRASGCGRPPRAQRAQAALVAIIMASAAVGGVSLVQDVVARRAMAAQRAAAPRDAAASALTAPSGGVTIDSTGDVLVADAADRPHPPLPPADRARRAARVRPPRRRRAAAGRRAGPVRRRGRHRARGGRRLLRGRLAQQPHLPHRSARRGRTITIAGSGAGGFDGDRKQAAQAALNGPSGLAVARNGDLYIADTLNNRVRMVEQATGMIRTIAGTGTAGRSEPGRRRRTGHGRAPAEPGRRGAGAERRRLHRRHRPQPHPPRRRRHRHHHHGRRRRPARRRPATAVPRRWRASPRRWASPSCPRARP